MTAFTRMGHYMVRGGYSPVPLSTRDGNTPLCALAPLSQRRLSNEEITRISRDHPGAQLAVALGFNGLIALDVDTDDPELTAAIALAIPKSSVKRRGSKGFVDFYQDPDGALRGRNFKKPDRTVLVELKTKGMVTIPQNLHRVTKKPYLWIGDPTLFNVPVHHLVELTPIHVGRLEKALAKWCPPKPVFLPPPPASMASLVVDKRMKGVANSSLTNAVADLASRVDGRGGGLFDKACNLGKFVHHGFLTYQEVEHALLEASRTNGTIAKRGLNHCKQQIHNGFLISKNDLLPPLGDRPRKFGRRREVYIAHAGSTPA